MINELEDEAEIDIKVTGFKPILETVTSAEQLKPFVDLKNVTKPGPVDLYIEFDTGNQYAEHPDWKPKTETQIGLQIYEALSE